MAKDGATVNGNRLAEVAAGGEIRNADVIRSISDACHSKGGIKNGVIIDIDIPGRTLNATLEENQIKHRLSKAKPPKRQLTSLLARLRGSYEGVNCYGTVMLRQFSARLRQREALSLSAKTGA